MAESTKIKQIFIVIIVLLALVSTLFYIFYNQNPFKHMSMQYSSKTLSDSKIASDNHSIITLATSNTVTPDTSNSASDNSNTPVIASASGNSAVPVSASAFSDKTVTPAASRNIDNNEHDDLRKKFLEIPFIQDKFTIVTPSYKRTENLYKLFQNYCPMTEIIHKIIILWNNIGEPVPEDVTTTAAKCSVPVIIKIMPKNNLTSRFYLYPEIETAAVFSVDDDAVFGSDTLSLAYKTWKEYPYLLVGYTPRTFGNHSNEFYYVASKGGNNYYTMILTGNALIHRFYLELYSTTLPKEIELFIVQTFNCEDISMNVVVGKYLTEQGFPQATGIEIAGGPGVKALHSPSKSDYSGLWHRKDHRQQRTDCLNLLYKVYGQLYLAQTNKRVTQ